MRTLRSFSWLSSFNALPFSASSWTLFRSLSACSVVSFSFEAWRCCCPTRTAPAKVPIPPSRLFGTISLGTFTSAPVENPVDAPMPETSCTWAPASSPGSSWLAGRARFSGAPAGTNAGVVQAVGGSEAFFFRRTAASGPFWLAGVTRFSGAPVSSLAGAAPASDAIFASEALFLRAIIADNSSSIAPHGTFSPCQAQRAWRAESGPGEGTAEKAGV
mmetsp:Transcript_9047/g.21064  ORF Transcript_9047/g.21064 Transcript_9047/m.21064 type:complete len:217 (+) Transcript_9047:461-1111(+)